VTLRRLVGVGQASFLAVGGAGVMVVVDQTIKPPKGEPK
jgi:hypothetical protein